MKIQPYLFFEGRAEEALQSISAPNEAWARRMFDALGQGVKVTMPLGKTAFALR